MLLALVGCFAVGVGSAHADPLYPEADLHLTQSAITVTLSETLELSGSGADPGSQYFVLVDTEPTSTGGAARQAHGIAGSQLLLVGTEEVMTNGIVESDGTFTDSFLIPREFVSGTYQGRVTTVVGGEDRQQSFEFVVEASGNVINTNPPAPLPTTGGDSNNTVRIALAVTLVGLAAAVVAVRRRRHATA
jgi:LPXTG-motif cell wall-anchored protein